MVAFQLYYTKIPVNHITVLYTDINHAEELCDGPDLTIATLPKSGKIVFLQVMEHNFLAMQHILFWHTDLPILIFSKCFPFCTTFVTAFIYTKMYNCAF